MNVKFSVVLENSKRLCMSNSTHTWNAEENSDGWIVLRDEIVLYVPSNSPAFQYIYLPSLQTSWSTAAAAMRHQGKDCDSNPPIPIRSIEAFLDLCYANE